MINLFDIPNYKIDTNKFTNLLHDKIVNEFESNFAKYVNAKYAVSFNSATSAIFLLFKILYEKSDLYKNIITIPSIIPPVVPNALINSGWNVKFNDNIYWVGNSYELHKTNKYRIIDSAQKVIKNQYEKEKKEDSDIMIFSFYPTKPIGSCDGGMIVSNNDKIIEKLRILTFNGMGYYNDSWKREILTVGHKMYMNSIQAYIANENLKKLDKKYEKLDVIRNIYNEEFRLSNESKYLYTMTISNRDEFICNAKKNKIICGIHYYALHLNPIYNKKDIKLPLSELMDKNIVSIPFHEKLKNKEINKIIKFVNEHR